MFLGEVLEKIPVHQHEIFFQEVEKLGAPYLYQEDKWLADYVRLRVVAIKDNDRHCEEAVGQKTSSSQ